MEASSQAFLNIKCSYCMEACYDLLLSVVRGGGRSAPEINADGISIEPPKGYILFGGRNFMLSYFGHVAE